LKKPTVIALHLLAWIAVALGINFLLWIYQFTGFLPVEDHAYESFLQVLSRHSILLVMMMTTGIVSFYWTKSLLLPAVLADEKFTKKILTITFLISFPLILTLLLSMFHLAVDWFFLYFALVNYFAATAGAITGGTIGLYSHWFQQAEQRHNLEKRTLQAEHALLKSQVSPHWLFNTLNAIDVLIEKNATLASNNLQELSDVLRFMLYEANARLIPLDEEIKYLNKYIRLQQIRSVNPNFVSISVMGESRGRLVEPMLFIPLIENAFKYVATKTVDNAIRISFKVQENALTFCCKNLYSHSPSESKKAGGLGIENVQQRLKIRYPNQHVFTIEKEDTYFTVTLHICP